MISGSRGEIISLEFLLWQDHRNRNLHCKMYSLVCIGAGGNLHAQKTTGPCTDPLFGLCRVPTKQ